MRRVLITGVTGTLGVALAAEYQARGWSTVGVSRRADAKAEHCARLIASPQRTLEDARGLLACDPDVAILSAGQIETRLGPGGLPLPDEALAIYQVNTLFPSLFALAAAEREGGRALDVVAIGSIADGSPSAFGPVYHASKVALHHFYTGVGPIVEARDPRLRLRLYRPGVIRSPLSWAPAARLNERGRRVRARRCERAPEAAVVARRIADWIDGDARVGGDAEPLSFQALKLLFALAPDSYARLQRYGWRLASRFA